MRESGGRGHRKFDRGRSFSPPKTQHRKSHRDAVAVALPKEPIEATGTRTSGQHLPSPAENQAGPSHQTAGSAPIYSSYKNLPSKCKQHESVRKSFSSEQLFLNEKPVQENSYFSLSSRSSNTSGETANFIKSRSLIF